MFGNICRIFVDKSNIWFIHTSPNKVCCQAQSSSRPHLNEIVRYHSCWATLYAPLCLCVSIWVSSVFYMKYLSLLISRIHRRGEISNQKLRTDRQQTNTQMYDTSYKDKRKLDHMLMIPFPVKCVCRTSLYESQR